MAILLLSATTHAATTSVTCPGGTPGGAHPSITVALGTLDNEGPHTITVTGTCTESVNIFQRNRLTIEAPAGQSATIIAAPTGGIVVRISGSQNITLRRLVVRDSGLGILVTSDSSVVMQAVQAINNESTGVRVDQNSLATLVGTNFPVPEPVVVSGNGTGISVDGSVLQLGGPSVVENNMGLPLIGIGGRITVTGGPADSVFRNNGAGLSFDGSVANFGGSVLIQNNGAVGVTVNASRVNFSASVPPLPALPRFTVIDGHTALGMNIAASGSVNFGGPNVIRNNGSATPDDSQFNGGVRVGTVSRIQFNGGEITNNVGHGVYSDYNGAISVAGVAFSNNSGSAVSVMRSSVGGFEAGNTFTGNGANVSCDDTSLVFGELVGVPAIQCKNIERSKGKPRPSVIKAN